MADVEHPLLRDGARTFHAWLKGNSSQEEVLAELAVVPPTVWYEFAARNPELMRADVSRKLATIARERIGSEPRAAVNFAKLAARVADHMVEDDYESYSEVAGNAAYMLALALKEVAEFSSALEACEQALFYYSLNEDAHRKEIALTLLVNGRILCWLGQNDRGLQQMQAAGDALWSMREKKKYIEARTMYASGLVGMGKIDEAIKVFQVADRVAKAEGDRETRAYIMNNVGLCYATLGDMRKARRSLMLAAEWFKRRGLLAELPRVKRNIAMIYRDEGNYPQAVSMLFEVRAEFIRLEMPVIAALAGIEIVEVKLLMGRVDEIEFLCGEMVKTLSDAGLPREARKALSYLYEVARLRPADMPDHIAHVRSFLDRFQGSADLVFTPPEGTTEAH
jgi:tetratricopeptide (TPR) repeat protein